MPIIEQPSMLASWQGNASKATARDGLKHVNMCVRACRAAHFKWWAADNLLTARKRQVCAS